MISGVVFTALRSLVNDRCYPSMFPQEDIPGPGTALVSQTRPTWPAIRYTIVDSLNEPTICGTNSRDTDSTVVQIDVVAVTYGAMVSLADQVIAALLSTYPPCVRDRYFETYDSETKTHRAILTYIFHASYSGGVSP